MFMTAADIDAKLEEEKRSSSAASHSAAWAEGLWAGIEPEIIAEEALETALEELVRMGCEDKFLDLLDQMRSRVIAGDFAAERVCH
ncbi:hypothetical protein [Nitratireductor basaltis]|uniref:Uncharacterized protein n=1 Tax=Nitratireductor basaltis TaxID=472175 RepID=A0A084UC88_9HYPH|nr:hypothetical protein [Nitratireductor basaltis]KFB10574.1 hypothetical protein EL18_01611 [Nitratireductor basaltis]